MLSVLVVSPSPEVPGGVSVFIAAMKRHLRGCAVSAFYAGGNGRESALAVAARLFTAPAALFRRVRAARFDAVHLNPSFDAKALVRDGLLLLALRAAGFRRVLVFFHGWDFGVQYWIARRKWARLLLARILNGTAFILVLDESFRVGLVALGVDAAKVRVTRTMFEGDMLREAGAQEAARPYILFMSRFDREKGGRELIEGFAALGRGDIDLVLAGDGADRREMEETARRLRVADRVRFTGYVGGAEKARLLNGCLLFALPSFYRSEGMPVAVLEAMGAGKPLLVGSAGALRSIAREPENGVVLGEITARSVGGGLRRLLGDEKWREEAGARNRETAWRDYEAAVVTAGIEAVYREVAAC